MYRTWAVVSFLTLHLPSHLVHLPKVDWISNPWSFVLCSVWLCKPCAAVDKSNDFVQFAKKTDDVCYHRNWIISHACHVSCSMLYVMFCVMLHVLCHVSCFMSCCFMSSVYVIVYMWFRRMKENVIRIWSNQVPPVNRLPCRVLLTLFFQGNQGRAKSLALIYRLVMSKLESSKSFPLCSKELKVLLSDSYNCFVSC